MTQREMVIDKINGMNEAQIEQICRYIFDMEQRAAPVSRPKGTVSAAVRELIALTDGFERRPYEEVRAEVVDEFCLAYRG